MSEKYKFKDPEAIYFTTSTIVYWIDLFTRRELRYIIINSLKDCQKSKGLIIHAWVLMPSHLHMIISSSDKSLSEILRDFKKFTSRRIVQEIENINESRKEWLLRAFVKAGKELERIGKYKVWKDGNHPILLDNNKLQQEKLDYIHQNPVEAEFVDEPEYYWYSSARDYCGKKGLIDVELIN
jgi:REP element-mobilizing transposase RayT